jgi:hypothetical protein
MNNENLVYSHTAYFNILKTRGMQGLQKNMPLWKFKLSEEEYEALKQTLRCHTSDLARYGEEAALCYAEWWRRDYRGTIPSKEDVAMGIGLHRRLGDDLYMAARKALQKHGYVFLHSLKGTEYFRTLLNQGGLPVNYIKNSGNIGNFSKFLKELVSELSSINLDWNDVDSSIIQQFNCISYLGKAFRNENIYDVSMQIAHAIIVGEKELLPYDDTDASLAELTKSLETAYSRAKAQRKTRPLSLHWKFRTFGQGQGKLYVNMDVVKDISSDSIPDLNITTCYSFDVFVAGTLVGKYVRKDNVRDEEGNVLYAVYTRITVGMHSDILWTGEPVVEVKVRCDNDDRLFLTIAGCYPPNFYYPQVFQMLDDNLYSMSETANAENNVAIFSHEWKNGKSLPITICDKELYYNAFTDELDLQNSETGEDVKLTNNFTPYTVEFSGNYISWVEKSNYKLLSTIPFIRVYDQEKNRVHNSTVKYRFRNDNYIKWRSLKSSCVFPCGLVDIRVELPDGHTVTETFYSIGKLKFISDNESVFSTNIICSCGVDMLPKINMQDGVDITQLGVNKWMVKRSKDSKFTPSLCEFSLYCAGNPTLRLSIAIPFDGVTVTDIKGNIVPNGKIVSLANLTNFCVVSHGCYGKKRNIDVSYVSDKVEDYSLLKHLRSKVIDGLVSLADYNDLIVRMFNLYGANSFDRSSSVAMNIYGTEIFIRKFVLESTIEDGKIRVIDSTEENTDDFLYDGEVYAFPVGDELSSEDFFVIKLERLDNSENLFTFPDDFNQQEVVVFSGPEAKRRMIPKYYNREAYDFDKQERAARSSSNTKDWCEALENEDVMMGKHWKNVCKAFDICSRYNLPFPTYNGLKPLGRNSKLLAKFVIAMWLNEYQDVLSQDIDRFEQEMVVAIHWIPAKIWEESIGELMATIPEALLHMMYVKMQSLVELLQELLNSTVSTDIAPAFAAFLVSGKIDGWRAFNIADIKSYCAKIHGLSDTNKDLPIAKFVLNNAYYPQGQRLLPSYRVMLETAMCAAENTCLQENCIDLFAWENREYARIVNFYRKYFKETYSDIFFKTVRYIKNK